MLTGVDCESGEGLPDDNIRAQCITLLVAGHETTSGLLSFALYYLLRHPEVVEQARAEVDGVLGHDEVWDLVVRGAAIFVCGNANTMAPGVRAALADIYRQHTGGTSAQAQDWLVDLHAQDRFLEDI